MKNQTVSFATVKKNGVITKIGNSTVQQPKINFKGYRSKECPLLTCLGHLLAAES